MGQTLAVGLAVLAAMGFGLGGALQHRVDRRASADACSSGLVVAAVARNPLWLFSLGVVGLAVACQALALALAPLVLVQPILVSSVISAAVSAALLDRRRPDRLVIVGAAGCSAGLAGFLLLSQPGEGQVGGLLPNSAGWPLAAGLGAVIVSCLLLASRRTGQARAICLALVAGTLYGVNAGLVKLALGQVGTGGLSTLLTGWPLYALLVAGPAGFVANQQAFAAGTAASLVVAVIAVADPLVSLGIGVSWLQEPVRTGGLFLAGEVAALVVVVVSVVMLAREAPQAARSSGSDPGTGRSLVLVTGASSGIGARTAGSLARDGHRLLLTGRDGARLATVAGNAGARHHTCDLTDPGQLDGLVAWAEAAGGPDVVVLNAGEGWAGPTAGMPGECASRLLAVNLVAPVLLVLRLLPEMLARGRGRLVLVSSIAGCLAVREEAVYGASKAGLTSFADSLRRELAGTGIEISVVVPGVVETPFFARRGRPYQRSRPRPVPPERVADTIAGLLADRRPAPEIFVPGWLWLPARLNGGLPRLTAALARRFD